MDSDLYVNEGGNAATDTIEMGWVGAHPYMACIEQSTRNSSLMHRIQHYIYLRIAGYITGKLDDDVRHFKSRQDPIF